LKIVVDTNVIAYHLIGPETFASEVRELWARVEEPVAPSIWEAEIGNVLCMAVRARVVAAVDAPALLTLARGLGIHSVHIRTLWQGALLRALESGVALYDTLFVELAEREGVPLATFDKKVLRTWPGIARRPRELT
jgi:predicted nucleic acid-binding protein